MKSYYGGLIGTRQRSLERYHPRPPTASHAPRLGAKLQSLLSQERTKLRTSNLAHTCAGFIRTKAHKNLGEKERGRIQGLPTFFSTPIISGTLNFVRTFTNAT